MYNNIKILAVDDSQEDTQFIKDCYKGYKDITDTVLEGLWMIDTEANTTYINKQLSDMLGYTQSEMINRHFFDFIDKNFHDNAKKFFERRKQGLKDKYDSSFVKKDGSTLSVMISAVPIFDDKGKFAGAMGLLTDITERKNMEDKLREREEFYHTIIESSNDMIWILDTEGNFLFFNKRTENITGYKLDDWKGKNFSLLVIKKDIPKITDIFHNTLNGQYNQYDTTIKSKSGKNIIVSVNTAPIYSKEKIIGTMSFGRDITENKKAEKKIKKTTEELSRSNKELEQFVYIASHDLQEPLRSISGFTELLSHRYKNKLDPDTDEFIDYIISGTKRMQQMINDLLALSQVGTRGKEFKQTNVTDILNDVLKNLHSMIERNNAIIKIDEMPIISADSSQLTQLFQNLIDNAIKFHKKDIIPQVHISIKQEEDEWIFSIQDNGTGIYHKNFGKLFVAFQRLHSREEYPGTGIGLAVCKKIVERHGGKIWIESKLGEGSIFYFSIPIKRGDNGNIGDNGNNGKQ